MSQVTFTQDLRQEFEADTLKLLRRRFLWLLGIVGTFYSLALLMTVAGFVIIALSIDKEVAAQKLTGVRGGYWGFLTLLGIIAADICVFLWCAREATLRRNDRQKLLSLTFQFFVFRGIADLGAAYILRNEGFTWYFGLYHVFACILLPWTPMQALRPMFVLIPLHAAVQFISEKQSTTGDVFWIFLSCVMVLPGLGISYFKTGRRSEEFKMRFLQDRYGQMRRELVDARRIHEALFPKPITDGPLLFSYKYEPMRQIGGDYLYARFSPPPLEKGEGEPAFNFLLIDVTGHGIAAALTVNRLYGEVERLFAEDPYASPADVLAALNRYVNLTLSRHSVFATALCIRVDAENDRIEFASGGHPPAFLCCADGTIHEMGSTAVVLGAQTPGEFDAGMQRLRFAPGDSLIAYTDGAIEARNPDGRMLGVFGLQKALSGCLSARTELVAQILAIVEQHRGGPPEDDTLVVEIARRVGDAGVDGRSGGGTLSSAPAPLRKESSAEVDAAAPLETISG